MSAKTIRVTTSGGILTEINVDTIKAVKAYKEVYHHDTHPDDKLPGAVIILDADVTGELADEYIHVDESVEEVKAMIVKFESSDKVLISKVL